MVAFKSQYHIVKKLGAGQFSQVHVAVRKTTADAIVARYRSSARAAADRRHMVAVLRAGMVALKTRMRDDMAIEEAGESLDREVAVLLAIKSSPNASLASIIDSDDVPSRKQGYIMPVYAGITLQALNNLWQPGDDRWPASFAWHICLQLVQSICNLHGISQAAGRPAISHRDLHEGNILLCKASAGDIRGNYPNVVMIDFGQASMTGSDASAAAKDMEFERQIQDYREVIPHMQAIDTKAQPAGLDDCLHTLEAVVNRRPSRTALQSAVREFVLRATIERDRAEDDDGDENHGSDEPDTPEPYRDLPRDLAALFDREVVSDEELVKVLLRE